MASRHGWIGGIASLALTLILGLALPSVAAAADGTGLVVEKDLVMKRLTLHTGVVLEVGDHTRLLSKEGKHITLDDFELAPTTLGLVQAYAPAMVRYSGRERDGVVEARMVRVKGTIPE